MPEITRMGYIHIVVCAEIWDVNLSLTVFHVKMSKTTLNYFLVLVEIHLYI